MISRRRPLRALVALVVLLGVLAPAPDGYTATLGYARGFGGPGAESAARVVVDESGNVYLAGRFNDTADFDPGPGTFNLTSASSSSGDAFVVKLDANGGLVWARRFGGTNRDRALDVVVDGSGHVYLLLQ